MSCGALKFTVNADGTIESGEWAVVVSYIEDLNPDGTVATHPEAAEESGPHQEFIRLINKGTLSGTIASGAASTSASGALVLNNLQLQITNGTMTFETFGAGVGSLDADLSQAAQGLLHLEF